MSTTPITQQPESVNTIFTLLPNEYIRFEYDYKPNCCWFSSKITTVTNMRLTTQVIKSPKICSKQSSSGIEKYKTIYLKDIDNIDIKQLESAIPSSQNKWWLKCLDILTCQCSNQQIDWVESCRGIENLAMDINEIPIEKRVSAEKF